MNKYFEFNEVFIDFSLSFLINVFNIFKNVDFVMNNQILFLENFEKYFEKEEWFDIFIDIYISNLHNIDKSNYNKMSLFYYKNLDEFYIFLNIKYLNDNNDN